MENYIMKSEKRFNLKPYTPNEDEWVFLKDLSDKLGLSFDLCPARGYRAAPAMVHKGVSAYVQSHIAGWKTKKEISISYVKLEHKVKVSQYVVPTGTVMQLEQGVFYTPDNIGTAIDRSISKDYIKPVWDLVAIINDRKISLKAVAKLLDKNPDLIQDIKDKFFSK